MKRGRMDRILTFMGVGLCAACWLAGCSAFSNSLAKQATPPSTISGESDIYAIKGMDLTDVNLLRPASSLMLIREGDCFRVTLNTCYLRFLQAVDPYIMVYSECWLGEKPAPAEESKYLRQVIYKKNGVSHQSRLALTDLPILGPIQLHDYNDVHVCIKVVVLSGKDDQVAIKLFEGLANTVATAFPQYSVLTGPATSLVSAIITQYPDSVEFEHSFTMVPFRHFGDAASISNNFNLILSTGQYAIIKREDPYRLVPWQTWYYYAYPLNWMGNPVSNESANREIPKSTKASRPKGWWGNTKWTYNKIIYGSKVTIQYLIRAPFWIARTIVTPIITPAEWDEPECKTMSIIAAEELKYSNRKLEFKTTENKFCPYDQKSYMIFNISKADASAGMPFEELQKEIDDHNKKITELMTDNTNESLVYLDAFVASMKQRKEDSHARWMINQAVEHGDIGTTYTRADYEFVEVDRWKKKVSHDCGVMIESYLDHYTTESTLTNIRDYIRSQREIYYDKINSMPHKIYYYTAWNEMMEDFYLDLRMNPKSQAAFSKEENLWRGEFRMPNSVKQNNTAPVVPVTTEIIFTK